MKKKFWLITTLSATFMLLAACSTKTQTVKSSNVSIKSSSKKIKETKNNDKYLKMIKKMSLDEKIGQLYFAHSDGNFKQIKTDLKKYHLGGITLFAEDFQNRSHQEFLRQIKQYQSNSKYGTFIAIDQEGGNVSRLSSANFIHRKFLTPQEIYKTKGMSGVIKEASEVAKILDQNGINMNFAPVADVAKNNSSFIYNRTLGQNYQTTSQYVARTVKAIQDQKVGAVLKHFPGYGDAGDTHTGFAAINKSLKSYKKEDLLPFKAGIDAGADGIMVSHIVIKSIDSKYPASLSKKVHTLLLKNLHYSGLIISDDLHMGAATQFAKKHKTNLDVLALKAGNDILLGGNYQSGIKQIKKAVKKGQIKEKQINDSVYRILRTKDQLGILK